MLGEVLCMGCDVMLKIVLMEDDQLRKFGVRKYECFCIVM
jgi:hypothetical protein